MLQYVNVNDEMLAKQQWGKIEGSEEKLDTNPFTTVDNGPVLPDGATGANDEMSEMNDHVTTYC